MFAWYVVVRRTCNNAVPSWHGRSYVQESHHDLHCIALHKKSPERFAQHFFFSRIKKVLITSQPCQAGTSITRCALEQQASACEVLQRREVVSVRLLLLYSRYTDEELSVTYPPSTSHLVLHRHLILSFIYITSTSNRHLIDHYCITIHCADHPHITCTA